LIALYSGELPLYLAAKGPQQAACLSIALEDDPSKPASDNREDYGKNAV
jgi:hypothetical protein